MIQLNTGSQHPSYHHHHQRNDATQKSRLLESIKGTAPSAEDVVGFTDRTVEETGSLPGIAKRNLESTLQTQPLQEDSDRFVSRSMYYLILYASYNVDF